MQKDTRRKVLKKLISFWSNAEFVIYVVIGLTLMMAALGGLGQLWWQRIIPWLGGKASLDVLQILDSLLLISMLAEIMQMVKISITQRRLSSEPFLIVGLISVVRRVLIITAEGSRYIAIAGNEETFTLMMVELAILALLLIVLIYGIRSVRQQRLDEARKLREEHRHHPADTPDIGVMLGNN